MKITLDGSQLKSVFILEDDDQRIAWFKEILSKVPILTICKKAGPGLEAVQNQKFDLIFLDHDLELDHYSAFMEGREMQTETTGLYVARHLDETINKDTPVIIHSMNPDGAEAMYQCLPGSTQLPFSILRETLQVDWSEE